MPQLYWCNMPFNPAPQNMLNLILSKPLSMLTRVVDNAVHCPHFPSGPRHSFPSSENVGHWGFTAEGNCPQLKAAAFCKVSYPPCRRLHPVTGWCDGTISLPQFRTTLKGYPTSRASHGIGSGLCCNFIAVRFLPLSSPASFNPTNVVFLRASPNK